MKTNFHIRPATLEDLPILRTFEQGVIRAERPFDSTLKEDPIQYYNLEDLIASVEAVLLVVEQEGTLVGSGYAKKEQAKPYRKHNYHAYLGFMFVDEAYRGMGVNGLLIEALKQWCLENDLTELRLDVYQDNVGAIKAYEKVGFKKSMINMSLSLEK